MSPCAANSVVYPGLGKAPNIAKHIAQTVFLQGVRTHQKAGLEWLVATDSQAANGNLMDLGCAEGYA